MRLLIASMAALAAVAFAAPSYAQTQGDRAPAPVPTAKPKPGTAAYCQSLKTSSSRSSCLKKVSAKATTTKASATTAAKKTKKAKTTPAAPRQPDVGQLTPSAAPAPAPAGTVAVPPLPEKTI
ncbi:MAG: hypothetical protein GEV13_21260 [Rhodospirillales bacterium]|nr:hypothetical protein [Rhodospirillales bacterium]